MAKHVPVAEMPRMTPAEWLAWEERQPERYELLWDEPTLMAGGSVRHDDIALNIASALRGSLRGTGCRVNTGDVKVGLPTGRWVYPDLLVRGTPRAGTETVIDDPVVVVEVLSPGTTAYNTTDKRWSYQEVTSLQHLVLVAQDRAKVEVASRAGDGTWRSVFHVGLEGTFRLDALDVTLPLAAVYEDVDLSPPAAAASADSAQSEVASEASTTAPNR